MITPWGKWQDEQRWLLLTDHCTDVAVVFRLLVAQPIIQARLAASAGDCLLPAHLDRLEAFPAPAGIDFSPF
ncbi:hypothetical protein GWK36_02530 [Caldichromatium japonicum]|uniref:HD Cas3-type domain-containing protein n=1 Tax=Caldichromatium japonicum TaxID=2699430 RepID=A0A6G7VAG4_9GAMM|nr:HD domain-containing protein [Caldichromatium japonicum]QIK37063.1 hypothetical protein GWK36_02530 [Caldichromatium japonicum]